MTKLFLTELEVGLDYGTGPGGFITVYGSPYRDLMGFMEVIYNDLRRKDKELFDLQRKNFHHLPGDIPRFHIHGEPINYKEVYNHFHVIYPHEPTDKDVEFILELLRNRIDVAHITTITKIR